MIAEVRKEVIPILIVITLLLSAMRYWWQGLAIPQDLSILVTAVTMTYFNARSTGAAVARALNGQSETDTEHKTGG